MVENLGAPVKFPSRIMIELMCCNSSSSPPLLMERIEGYGIWGYWSRTWSVQEDPAS